MVGVVSGVVCASAIRFVSLSTLFWWSTSLLLLLREMVAVSLLLLVVVVMVVVSSVVGCTTGVEVSPGFVCISLEEDMVGLMEMKQNVLEGYY